MYDLNKLSSNFNFKIKAEEAYRLPHFRYLEFKSDDSSLIIRIDGGIVHGLKPVDRLISEDMSYEN